MKKSLCAFMLFASSPALAEETTLAEIKVVENKDSLVSPSIETAKEKLEQIPGGVALVDAKEFEKTRAVTLKDMLGYTPGVFAQPKVAEESRLSIRGSGLSRNFHLRGVNLYQDGIPINLSDGAGDFQDIDPLAYRFVEVYKGANGLKFGSSSLGGAINFVTPTGYDASPLTARIEAGSFNTLRQQVSSGGVVGKSDYFVSASHLISDGYRDQSDQNSTRFSGNVGQKLNDNLETRLYLTYGDINQQLPGSLTKAQLKNNPKQAIAGNILNNNQRNYEALRLANKTTWQGDGIEVNGGVYTTQKSLFHPIFQVIEQNNRDYGVFANTTLFGDVAGYENEFVTGMIANTGHTDSKRFTNVGGKSGVSTFDGDDRAKNVNVYFENSIKPISDWTFTAGSQVLYADRDFRDNFLSNGDQSEQREFFGVSPKIGAIYDVSPNIQLFTNLSRAYEPPTFSELEQALPGIVAFNTTDAQKSTTLEIGTRGSWKDYNWDASVYHARVKDELMTFSLGGGSFGVLNADNTVHNGLELGFGVDLSPTVSSRVAYTYSDFSFDNDPVFGDNDLPGAPKHYLRAEVKYKDPAGFYIAPNVETSPQKYAVDMSNTLFADPYTIFGLQMGYDLTENVTLFVDARNLTDKNYAATVDTITSQAANVAVFSPGDGRSFFTGLTYKW